MNFDFTAFWKVFFENADWTSIVLAAALLLLVSTDIFRLKKMSLKLESSKTIT